MTTFNKLIQKDEMFRCIEAYGHNVNDDMGDIFDAVVADPESEYQYSFMKRYEEVNKYDIDQEIMCQSIDEVIAYLQTLPPEYRGMMLRYDEDMDIFYLHSSEPESDEEYAARCHELLTRLSDENRKARAKVEKTISKIRDKQRQMENVVNKAFDDEDVRKDVIDSIKRDIMHLTRDLKEEFSHVIYWKGKLPW